MNAPRVDHTRILELIRLHRSGLSPREVARELMMGPNTERKYRQALRAAALLEGDAGELPALHLVANALREAIPPRLGAQQISQLTAFSQRILTLRREGASAREICRRLQQEGVTTSVGSVKRLLARTQRESAALEERATTTAAACELMAPGSSNSRRIMR
jgi:DNA-binding CsgD family transcriptional regulator